MGSKISTNSKSTSSQKYSFTTDPVVPIQQYQVNVVPVSDPKIVRLKLTPDLTLNTDNNTPPCSPWIVRVRMNEEEEIYGEEEDDLPTLIPSEDVPTEKTEDNAIGFKEWLEDPAIRSQIIEAIATLNCSDHYGDVDSDSTVVSQLQTEKFEDIDFPNEPTTVENQEDQTSFYFDDQNEEISPTSDFDVKEENFEDKKFFSDEINFRYEGSSSLYSNPYVSGLRSESVDMDFVLDILESDVDVDKQNFIDVFQALATPNDLEIFNNRLQSLSSSQSIITNVEQWKREMEQKQAQKLKEEFEFQYNTYPSEDDLTEEDFREDDSEEEEEEEVEKLYKTEFFYLECLEEI